MQTSLDFASLAEKESKLFQVNTNTSGAGILPVNVVYKKSFPAQESQRQTDPKSKMGGKQCFRCGSPRHLADKCSHVASACNCCGKPGHLAKEHFKKRTKELGGNNTTHKVTATPTSGTCTKEEQVIQPFLELFLCKECNLLEIRQLQRPYTNLLLQFKTGESLAYGS